MFATTPSQPTTLKQFFDDQKASLLITAIDSGVLYSNKQATNVTGFSSAELIGKKPGKLFGGQMTDSFYKNLWHVISETKQPFVGTIQNKKKDGTLYWEQLHVAPILDDAQKIKFFIEIKPSWLSTGMEHHAFAKRFIDVFKDQKGNGAGIIKFVCRSVSALHEACECSHMLPAASQENSDRLYNFLNAALVIPTASQYAARVADGQLVLNAQNNKQDFDVLYHKYYADIVRYLKKRVPDESIAEDLAQETFIKAFKYLPTFVVTNASYATYLLTVAHNLLVSFYRDGREKYRLAGEEQLEEVAAVGIDYAARSDAAAVWSVVQSLSEPEQKIMHLKYREDLMVKDIARVLEKTENAVKLVLSRARKKVRLAFAVAG